jgi:hypothetical protein
MERVKNPKLWKKEEKGSRRKKKEEKENSLKARQSFSKESFGRREEGEASRTHIPAAVLAKHGGKKRGGHTPAQLQ